jgi:uncharacterized protein (DUF1330 family)
MAAYIIAALEVLDEDLFAQYRARVPSLVAQFGGRYVIRGGAVEPVEGEPMFSRLTVLEFADVAAARRFLDSPQYAPVKQIRLDSCRSRLSIVEGVA